MDRELDMYKLIDEDGLAVLPLSPLLRLTEDWGLNSLSLLYSSKTRSLAFREAGKGFEFNTHSAPNERTKQYCLASHHHCTARGSTTETFYLNRPALVTHNTQFCCILRVLALIIASSNLNREATFISAGRLQYLAARGTRLLPPEELKLVHPSCPCVEYHPLMMLNHQSALRLFVSRRDEEIRQGERPPRGAREDYTLILRHQQPQQTVPMLAQTHHQDRTNVPLPSFPTLA